MRSFRQLQARVLFFLALTLPIFMAQGQRLPTISNAPPAEVQGQSFSVGRSDALTSSGVHPADILGVGGVPLILCADLGLLCSDPTTNTVDDLTGLSYGADFSATGLPPLQFSVTGGAQGMSNTAVHGEAGCSPAQVQADVFETALDGANQQDLDGDGVACTDNAGFGLGLTEDGGADNLDALAPDPCQFVDLDCNGVPDAPIFFTLAPDSPTLALIGATPADILIAGIEFAPLIWANGVTALGLAPGDSLDGLCLQENGNGVYDSADQLLFSLAPGSPTLTTLAASGADLLQAAPLRVRIPAAALGLAKSDNLDAIACADALALQTLYLPLIRQQ